MREEGGGREEGEGRREERREVIGKGDKERGRGG